MVLGLISESCIKNNKQQKNRLQVRQWKDERNEELKNEKKKKF